METATVNEHQSRIYRKSNAPALGLRHSPFLVLRSRVVAIYWRDSVISTRRDVARANASFSSWIAANSAPADTHKLLAVATGTESSARSLRPASSDGHTTNCVLVTEVGTCLTLPGPPQRGRRRSTRAAAASAAAARLLAWRWRAGALTWRQRERRGPARGSRPNKTSSQNKKAAAAAARGHS
jgi:hypothetical protein